MTDTDPRAELHVPFSDPKATATPWAQARDILERAEVFWLSTVRPDGRPHVTPLVAVWLEGSLYFCTGHDELKAKRTGTSSESPPDDQQHRDQRAYDPGALPPAETLAEHRERQHHGGGGIERCQRHHHAERPAVRRQ
jgi:hypothetical protein